MSKVILHCDLNCFFASVEMLYHPELRNVPMAIAGDPENRHGIILAKNVLAKKCKIKTGEPIFEAKKKCPNLVVREPDYESYMYYSKKVKDLYYEYTDRVESFGIDEAWLDITESIKYFGSIKNIVENILNRVKNEIGLTLSIGVSNNKIWAKLGSDIALEDSYYVISNIDDIKDNDVGSILNCGFKTTAKLKEHGINTIGDLAKSSPNYLKQILGINGETLWYFANGYDLSDVKIYTSDEETIKSIGNSVTTIRDIYDMDDLKLILTVLSDSVASRIKDSGMYYKTVHLNLRNKKLEWRTMQITLKENTNLAKDIFNNAVTLFYKNCLDFKIPYRTVGVTVSNLSFKKEASEINIYGETLYSLKEMNKDLAMEEVRRRFGYHSINSLRVLEDKELSDFNPKEEHQTYPVSYFGTK